MLSFRSKVVTHASQSERPILRRVCASRAADVNYPAQPPILREKVLQRRVPVREASTFRHGRKGSKLSKNAFRRTAKIFIVEV